MVELIFFLFIAIVAVGSGLRILRGMKVICHSLSEEIAFAFGLGMGVLALGVMALGLSHLLYEASLYLLLIAFGVAGSKELIGVAGRFSARTARIHLPFGSFNFWLVLLIAVGVAIDLTRALTPAYGAVDPLAYHLALPKIYLKRHFLSFEPSITGTLYPSNTTMLFTLGIGLRGAILAQVIHFFMGMACLGFIVIFCRRHFDLQTGLWAAAIFSFTPVLVFFAPLGYVDAGLCFFQFLAFWCLLSWLEEPENRMLILGGIFAGLTLGDKHTAIPMWLASMGIVIGFSLWKRIPAGEMVRRCLLWGGISLILVAPWYVRAYVEAGNPIWPLANHLFHGAPYKGTFNVGISSSPTSAVLPSMERLQELVYWCAMSLWEWTWNNQLGWQKAIGVYFVAFLPGLLVYGRNRRLLLLAVFCLLYYLLVVLRIDGNPRYNISLFAFLSIVAGYVGRQAVSGRLKRFRLIIQLAFCFTLVCNIAHSFALSKTSIDYLLSTQSQEQFLGEREGNYRVFRVVNKHLPESSVLLLQGIVKGFYCDRLYLWDHPYQMVINYQECESPEDLLQRMHALGISHIVRMIYIPPLRIQGVGYPQYFADPFHEDFRKKYLKLIYKDESYVLFEVMYPTLGLNPANEAEEDHDG